MDMFDNQGYEFVFVFISFVRFVLPFYLPLGITDQGSHGGLFSPLPTTVRTFHFCREETSALSSLVDSRRTAPTHAISRRSQQLTHFYVST